MKILVILSRFPYPLEKGDKLRAYNQIKELSKNNEIILFALNDTNLHPEAFKELKKHTSHIEVFHLSKLDIVLNLGRTIFSDKPFQVGYFYHSKAQKKINQLIERYKPDHIYCQLIRTAEYCKYSSISKTLDYMDVFSQGMAKRKATESVFLKPFVELEYKRLVKYEESVFSFFNNKTIISEQDKRLIPHSRKSEITVIPNGVDTSYFKPIETTKVYDIVFNGNMNYPPNIESVEFLVKKILPVIKREMPGIKVLISGANPSARVKALASSNVVVTGWVDDIRTNLASAKMLVAPMQISIGLQNKLLEAMAMKIPCVTSLLANNALGAENNKEILTAEKPQEYAEAILKLLKDTTFAESIALEGYKFATKNFDWQQTTSKLEQLMLS